MTGGFSPILGIELLADIVHVALDRAYRDHQFFSDLAIGTAQCDQMQHLQFAFSQWVGKFAVGLMPIRQVTFTEMRQ